MRADLISHKYALENFAVNIVCGKHFFSTESATYLLEAGVKINVATNYEQFVKLAPNIVIYDNDIRSLVQNNIAQRNYTLIAEENQDVDADLFVPVGFTKKATLKNIEHAVYQYIDIDEKKQYTNTIKQKDSHIQKLTDLALALSSEKKLSNLLERILHEGRKLAVCDAASLYLLEGDEQARSLVFKLVQNASIEFPFEEHKVELSDKSIAGYVANHGEEIYVNDAYKIPADAPFSFNTKFDELTGYRCISLLAIPIKNHQDEVIGVLQFINKKDSPAVILVDEKMARQHVVDFDNNTRNILRGLASLSAIAIENKILTENIKNLFDGFVSASVAAIEQRDPATSGHSFRVADLSVALAKKVDRAIEPRFKAFSFSDHQIRELKYAALLHDFGKVGVRESVLVKAKKLYDHQLAIIERNILLIKESLKREYFEDLCATLDVLSKDAKNEKRLSLQERLSQLDHYWHVIRQANEPTVLSEQAPALLDSILKYSANVNDIKNFSIISNEEYKALSIPRGSLSDEEREEIQSHVTHTENFLKLIPWTNELSNVPSIAGAHHEKLNGSGYPRGLTANDIPMQAKIMTICDIFDALTASDRPYKPAVRTEKAFDILFAEANNGYLDKNLVELFIEAKVYEAVNDKDYSNSPIKKQHCHHHVCDFDLMERD